MCSTSRLQNIVIKCIDIYTVIDTHGTFCKDCANSLCAGIKKYKAFDGSSSPGSNPQRTASVNVLNKSSLRCPQLMDETRWTTFWTDIHSFIHYIRLVANNYKLAKIYFKQNTFFKCIILCRLLDILRSRNLGKQFHSLQRVMSYATSHPAHILLLIWLWLMLV